LHKQGFHEDVVSSFAQNRICGTAFCKLTDEDLKDLLPVLGDRACMRKLLYDVKKVFPITVAIIFRFSLKDTLPFKEVGGSSSASGSGLGSSDKHSEAVEQNMPSPASESPLNHEWHVSFAIPELDVFSASVSNAIQG